jgi:hypothetical protein
MLKTDVHLQNRPYETSPRDAAVGRRARSRRVRAAKRLRCRPTGRAVRGMRAFEACAYPPIRTPVYLQNCSVAPGPEFEDMSPV